MQFIYVQFILLYRIHECSDSGNKLRISILVQYQIAQSVCLRSTCFEPSAFKAGQKVPLRYRLPRSESVCIEPRLYVSVANPKNCAAIHIILPSVVRTCVASLCLSYVYISLYLRIAPLETCRSVTSQDCSTLDFDSFYRCAVSNKRLIYAIFILKFISVVVRRQIDYIQSMPEYN